MDVVYVVGTVVFFALMLLLVTSLDTLGHEHRLDHREP